MPQSSLGPFTSEKASLAVRQRTVPNPLRVRTCKTHTCITNHLHISILARITLNVVHAAVKHAQRTWSSNLLVSEELLQSDLAPTARLARCRETRRTIRINSVSFCVNAPGERLRAIAVVQVNV